MQPFYDPAKTYYENLSDGPFGAFADNEIFPTEEPRFDFVGLKIAYPFGIPAGPLLDSKFIRAAFNKGFDVNVYKTTRSAEFPCHAFPNVLSVHVDGDLTPEKSAKPLIADTHYSAPLSITNSFGVPSRPVSEWKADAKTAVMSARTGQVMIMSVMGTVKEHQTPEEFIADYAQAARDALETSASVYEINLSCPNIGNEGLVCYNTDMSARVARAVKEVLGDKPLILKIGYYKDNDSLREFLRAVYGYCEGISAINTIQAEILDAAGNHPLPGKNRERSGVCGASITWAGLEMTKRLAEIRSDMKTRYAIIGVGGVMTPSDFRKFRDAGADVVQSATGAMWNPYLAKEIKEAYPDG
jgi:dihydroorotate dehydrogenase